MKKIVFDATVTAVALAAVIFSFATMPEGRALSGQEKLVSHGLDIDCQDCVPDKGCNAKQDIPTIINPNAEVLICSGTKSKTTTWSNSMKVTNITEKYDCFGAVYKCQQDENGDWSWVYIKTTNVGCGTWSECNSKEGGWKTGLNGEIIDGTEDYKKQCEKNKPNGE